MGDIFSFFFGLPGDFFFQFFFSTLWKWFCVELLVPAARVYLHIRGLLSATYAFMTQYDGADRQPHLHLIHLWSIPLLQIFLFLFLADLSRLIFMSFSVWHRHVLLPLRYCHVTLNTISIISAAVDESDRFAN